MKIMNYKQIILILLTGIFSHGAYGQDSSLDANEFKNALKSIFTKITNTSENSLGQGASINTSNGLASIEYTLVPQDSLKAKIDVINFKLEGGSTDGFLNVFSNSRFNTNLNISANYLLIDYSNSTRRIITFDDGSEQFSGVKLNWWSFGYRLRHQALSLFNPAEAFQNQITQENYISHEFSASYNKYKWARFDTWKRNKFKSWDYYLSASLRFAITNNSSLLNSVEVSEVTNQSDSLTTRSTERKFNAFVGNYEEDIHNLNLDLDYYLFPFKENPVGLHINPVFQFTENEKPVLNLDIGVLAPFTNKSEQKTSVNLELFYSFLDITNNTNSNYRLFERNNIGFKVTFPINFKNI